MISSKSQCDFEVSDFHILCIFLEITRVIFRITQRECARVLSRMSMHMRILSYSDSSSDRVVILHDTCHVLDCTGISWCEWSHEYLRNSVVIAPVLSQFRSEFVKSQITKFKFNKNYIVRCCWVVHVGYASCIAFIAWHWHFTVPQTNFRKSHHMWFCASHSTFWCDFQITNFCGEYTVAMAA